MKGKMKRYYIKKRPNLSKSSSSIFFLYKTPFQKNDLQQKEFVKKLGFYLLIVNYGSDKQMLNFFCTNLDAFELNLVKLNFNLMKFESHSIFFNWIELNINSIQLGLKSIKFEFKLHTIWFNMFFSSFHFMIIGASLLIKGFWMVTLSE